MRIACISFTKNEGDIIEAFVRINSRICNSFFFIDDSTDNTREILNLLIKDGFDINFIPSTNMQYNQPYSTRTYIQYVKKAMNPDWVFLLDADEMVIAADIQEFHQELQDLPSSAHISGEWKTYVPVALNYFESRSPLSECFRQRKVETETFRKVAIPGPLANSLITTPGNHTAKFLDGKPGREHMAKSYYLAHFPVRSPEQIIVKNLMAAHNLRSRVDVLKGEGFHVFHILNRIRTNKYRLSLEELGTMALNYARGDKDLIRYSPEEFFSEIDPELEAKLSYLDLGKIDIIGSLDHEIERLSMKIKELVAFRGEKIGARYIRIME